MQIVNVRKVAIAIAFHHISKWELNAFKTQSGNDSHKATANSHFDKERE